MNVCTKTKWIKKIASKSCRSLEICLKEFNFPSEFMQNIILSIQSDFFCVFYSILISLEKSNIIIQTRIFSSTQFAKLSIHSRFPMMMTNISASLLTSAMTHIHFEVIALRQTFWKFPYYKIFYFFCRMEMNMR